MLFREINEHLGAHISLFKVDFPIQLSSVGFLLSSSYYGTIVTSGIFSLLMASIMYISPHSFLFRIANVDFLTGFQF